MGICTSLPSPIRTGSDDVGPGSQRLSFLSRLPFLSRSNSGPPKATKEKFAGTLHDSSCYWVYARILDTNKFLPQCFYALDLKKKTYLRLPDHPMNKHTESASTVLDNNLYAIGGRVGTFVSHGVFLFDPVLHQWSVTSHTAAPRRAPLAASVDGNVYVFGGNKIRIADWAEVYKPSTKTWERIPSSQTLADALNSGLSPLRASAVLEKKIILRGSRTGIAFDLTSNSWIAVSENLIKGWWNCTRAAVVQNMLITCHCEYGIHEIHQLSIRAYVWDEDVWLILVGIDRIFHENAHKSKFMSVNGNLVIYYMCDQTDLLFSIFEINERIDTTLRANLLWQSRFPMSKIIKQGFKNYSGYLAGSLFKANLVEALRPDAL